MKLSREKNLPLVTAAAKAGMGEKAARKYIRSGLLPSQMKKPRDWRTREDPFTDVWPEVEALIKEAPGLEALTVFQELQRRYPGEVSGRTTANPATAHASLAWALRAGL